MRGDGQAKQEMQEARGGLETKDEELESSCAPPNFSSMLDSSSDGMPAPENLHPTMSKQSTAYTPTKKVARNTNGAGYAARGAYPNVSRDKMAGVLGVHKSSVSNMLLGRTRPSLDIALRMAKEIGVEVEELQKELVKWQVKRKAAQVAKTAKVAKVSQAGKLARRKVRQGKR